MENGQKGRSLSHTVATVSIVARVRARAHARSTLDAVQTVAAVCNSSSAQRVASNRTRTGGRRGGEVRTDAAGYSGIRRPYHCHDAGLHRGRQVRPLFDHTLQIAVERGYSRFNCCASCSAVVRRCCFRGVFAGLQLDS